MAITKTTTVERIEILQPNLPSAAVTENEYLFRVNVFNRNTDVPKRYRNRTEPLKISRGFKHVDELIN